MFLTIWVALVVLCLWGLGAFAYIRNRKAETNRNFAFFVGILGFWIIANCLGSNFKSHVSARFFIYADFSLAPLLVFAFWNFAYKELLQMRQVKKRVWQNVTLFASTTGILFLSALIGKVVRADYTSGMVRLHLEVFYWPYSLAIALIAFIGVWNLFVAQRKARGVARAQFSLMLVGLAIAAVALVFANLVVPTLTNSEPINLEAGNASYISLVLLVLIMTYAIVKHRLFDIRLVVARSVAYILVLFVLITGYTVLSIVLSDLVLDGTRVNWAQRGLYIGLAIVAGLILPVVKRFFDKFTNRLFYRDAYDSQELFNSLNKLLVTTFDLDLLLNKVVALVNENIKTDFFTIMLMNTNTAAPSHIAGLPARKFNDSDISVVHNLLKDKESTMIVTDELDKPDSKLKSLLSRNNIAVFIPLAALNESKNLGHIILGLKKSGNSYTSRDLTVIETIANELAIAIQNALRFEEIENFNATLQQKIDVATHKLQRTNEKLRQLDETKDDFISMASHQLRTPLTSVKGYVSMVLDGDGGSLTPLQRKLLNQSFISAQRMVYLISDLLNVSRLRTGKFIIERMPTNLATVVQEEVRQLVETADGRNLQLIFHKPEHFPSLMLDETKIRQVVMNFIDNAIYYTPTGGKITVKLEDRAQSVELTVTDTGIGVPRDEQHHLFSKFYRADNAKRARPDGTGLGLFMAKKVIAAQGGAVIFKSTEGKGSTFGFTFAKAPLAVPTHHASQAEPVEKHSH